MSVREIYTIQELSEAGYGARSTIYRQIMSGNLRAVKIGAKTGVLAKDLQDWLAALPTANPA